MEWLAYPERETVSVMLKEAEVIPATREVTHSTLLELVTGRKQLPVPDICTQHQQQSHTCTHKE